MSHEADESIHIFRFLDRKEFRPAWVLAGIIILGYVIAVAGDFVRVCHVSSLLTICDSATNLLVQNNGLIMGAHTIWQLYTSIFVTDSFFDAGFNALAVLILDRMVDNSFNHTRFFAIFLLTALLGNLFSLANPPNYSSAGASGGIFGLFAAAFSFTWAAEKKIDRPTLLLFLALFFVSSFLFANVDYLAHLGGSLGGFVAGPVLYRLLKEKISNFQPVSSSTFQGRLITGGLVTFLTAGSIIQFLLFASV